ncbi:MAG: hydroxymethylbilane synthase [Deltaproteobacteria bacterium]|nr:hydroxymethylbilane synthase [Deltaproteobacteria bacterium]
MKKETIIIGTRGSRLALWQAEWVRDRLGEEFPDMSVELSVIKTIGDKILDVPLAKIGGKGLFVKEIEEALLSGRIDIAVHSMKDMPAELPDGLCIAAIPEREDPRDVFISANGKSLQDQRTGAVIGTSSLRRSSQVLHYRPDVGIIPLRGNLDTRLKKLDSGGMDAIILAAAGVKRLGMADRISQVIPSDIILPAVAQGALCIEARQEDEETLSILSKLHHRKSALAVRAERAFMRRLEGGCQVPIAALAGLDGKQLEIVGLVAEIDGSSLLKETVAGDIEHPEDAGLELSQRLLDQGAGDIIQRLIDS